MNMYVLHVQTGRELLILRELKRKKIDAYVPQEVALLRNGGKWHEIERTLMPGYVFIKTEFNAAVYYTVKAVSGIIRFLGSPPTPLSDTELEQMKWMLNDGEPIIPSEAIVEDDKLIITSGVLKGFEGNVISFDRRQKRATALVSICGKEHEVTLSVDFKDS